MPRHPYPCMPSPNIVPFYPHMPGRRRCRDHLHWFCWFYHHYFTGTACCCQCDGQSECRRYSYPLSVPHRSRFWCTNRVETCCCTEGLTFFKLNYCGCRMLRSPDLQALNKLIPECRMRLFVELSEEGSMVLSLNIRTKS
jgi:hypothetical protein